MEIVKMFIKVDTRYHQSIRTLKSFDHSKLNSNIESVCERKPFFSQFIYRFLLKINHNLNFIESKYMQVSR